MGYQMSLCDSFNINSLCKKFQITSRKTYVPCNISEIENDNFFIAWLIGFIDGDGSMDKRNGYIRIKIHNSWENNLNLIAKRLDKILNFPIQECKINKKGYAILNLNNYFVINYLKLFCSKANLPVLSRKWDRIDLTKIHQKRNNKRQIEQILENLKDGISAGLTFTELRKKYNIGVYKMYRYKKKLLNNL